MILFENTTDYKTFMLYVIEHLLSYPSLQIIAYCILPDHFHFILKNKYQWFDISEFMRKLQVSYAMYFKRKHTDNEQLKWIPVFSWRFKAHKIENDEELKHFEWYVNYNAVNHKLVENIDDWPYCSIHQLVATTYNYLQQTHIKVYNEWKKIQKSTALMAELEW